MSTLTFGLVLWQGLISYHCENLPYLVKLSLLKYRSSVPKINVILIMLLRLAGICMACKLEGIGARQACKP